MSATESPPEVEYAITLVKKWYLPIVMGMLCIGGVFYITATMKARSRESLARGSEVMSELHSVFSQFATGKTKGINDQKEVPTFERVGEAIKIVEDSDIPYRDFAPLYRARVLQLENRTDEATSSLTSLPNWQDIDPSNNQKRFVAELGALLTNRIHINDTAKQKISRENLKALSLQGSFVAVPAALAFSRASSTIEQRQEAKTLLNQVKEKFPAQVSLLAPEISSLGIL